MTWAETPLTEREEKALNLLIEWRNTRGEIAIAFIALELKLAADKLIKERREAGGGNSEKGQGK
jgi:hypothetical protein